MQTTCVATRHVGTGDLCQGSAFLGLTRWTVVALEHYVTFQVGVEGQVRGPLATGFREAAHDLVFPDVSRLSRAWIGFPRCRGRGGGDLRRPGGFEEALDAGRQGVLHQAQGLTPEFGVGRAIAFEEPRPLRCRQLGGTGDQLAELPVSIGVVGNR